MARFTPEQRERIKLLTFTTHKSAEQIAEDVRVSASGVRKFWQEEAYRNDVEGYKNRAQAGSKQITPEQLQKIEHLTLTTKYSTKKIAVLTNCSETFVLNTQRDIIFKGNQDAYKQHIHNVRSEAQNNRESSRKLTRDEKSGLIY